METAYQALPCRSGTLGRACSCSNGSCEKKWWMELFSYKSFIIYEIASARPKRLLITKKLNHFLKQLILVLEPVTQTGNGPFTKYMVCVHLYVDLTWYQAERRNPTLKLILEWKSKYQKPDAYVIAVAIPFQKLVVNISLEASDHFKIGRTNVRNVKL